MKTFNTLRNLSVVAVALLVMNSFKSNDNDASVSLPVSDFKTGTFELFSPEFGKSTVIRHNDFQIESSNGKSTATKYFINWLDETTYTLVNSEKKDAPVLINKIINTKGNSYTVKSYFENTSKAYVFEMRKL